MTSTDMNRVWQDVVSLTDRSENDTVRSLRIALLFALCRPADRPSWRQACRVLKHGRTLLSARQLPVLPIPEGKFVFFFVSKAGLDIRHLLPVAREAQTRGLLGGIVTLSQSLNIKEFDGLVPIVTAQTLLSHLGTREKFKIVAEARRVLKEISNKVAQYDSAYVPRLRSNAGDVLDHIITSLQMAKAFRLLFETWRPSCVVAPSDFWPTQYQFAGQASSLQIPSVVIQHGVSNFFCWPFVSDLCCVWGENFADEMKRFGVPPERLSVVGLPYTDTMFRKRKPAQFWRERGRTQPVCLFLSQTHGSHVEPEIFAAYRRLVIDVLERCPTITWKVKLHPMEDDSFYRGMGIEVFSRLVFHPKSTSLEDAVSDADVVTTAYSTSGLDAMIMQRPLIVAPVTPRVRELAWWPALGGGTYADSADDLQLQLMNIITNSSHWTMQLESQHAFLATSFANHGHAAERIVDLLQSRFIGRSSSLQPELSTLADSVISTPVRR